MISLETIQRLATQYQTSEFPNTVREYFQNLFLSKLYEIEGAENLLFKGGTALRMIYGSPRFSEDLDFSIFNVAPRLQKNFIENTFAHVLAELEKIGIKVELGPKPGPTAEGYYGDATFQIYDYPSIGVSINVSARNGRGTKGEIDSITNDFVPTYNVFHLPQAELVEEKVFNALLKRKKTRDFYDLYFIMRKGLLSPGQKKKLAEIKGGVITDAKHVDFQGELGTFLPSDQHAVMRDFSATLERELNRQLSEV